MGCAHSREALNAALLQASEGNRNMSMNMSIGINTINGTGTGTGPGSSSDADCRKNRSASNHLHRAFACANSSSTSSSTHRDVFSIFGEQGMALELEPRNHTCKHKTPVRTTSNGESMSSPLSCRLMCSPCSMSAASLFSNATTTASDSEDRAHQPMALATDRFLPKLHLRYGVCSDKGMRKMNEDRMVCTAHGVEEAESVAFFGIYDGHNGAHVANYLAEHLHTSVFDHFEQHQGEWTTCIETAFAATDERIFQDAVEGGSTAIAVVVHEQDVVIACVGDSRAIVGGHNGDVRVVSSPHTPEVPNEHARILAAKGIVSQGRIFGLLSVSRSFGDIDFKTSRGEFKQQFEGDLVSAEPDVLRHTLTPDDAFIVLGSDGLFDVMHPQQVVDFVRMKMAKHGNVQHASEELVSYAISMGSTDNVSVIVVAVNPLDQDEVDEA